MKVADEDRGVDPAAQLGIAPAHAASSKSSKTSAFNRQPMRPPFFINKLQQFVTNKSPSQSRVQAVRGLHATQLNTSCSSSMSSLEVAKFKAVKSVDKFEDGGSNHTLCRHRIEMPSGDYPSSVVAFWEWNKRERCLDAALSGAEHL